MATPFVFVQGKGANATDTNGESVAYTNNVLAGSLLVFCAVRAAQSLTVSTISDTLGSIWTQQALFSSSSRSATLVVYTATAPAAGANTVALTWSAQTSLQHGTMMAEFHGPMMIVRDGTAKTAQSASSASIITPANESHYLDSLLISFVFGVGATPAAQSPWTSFAATISGAVASFRTGVGPANYTPNVTQTASSEASVMIALAEPVYARKLYLPRYIGPGVLRSAAPFFSPLQPPQPLPSTAVFLNPVSAADSSTTSAALTAATFFTANADAIAAATGMTTAATFVVPSSSATSAAQAATTAAALITANSDATSAGAAALSPVLVPQPAATSAAQAAITAAALLSPAPAATAAAQAATTAAAVLSPSSTATSSAAAAITARALLTPTSAATSAAQATVTAATFLTPSSSATSAAQATTIAATTVSPSSSATSAAQAATTAAALLSPSSTASSTATAILIIPLLIVPTSAATSSATAALLPVLVPQPAAVSAAQGAISARALLSPTATATSAATATLTAATFVTPTSSATSAAQAATTAPALLAPSPAATSAAQAAMTAAALLVPTSSSTSTATAAITARALLTASAVATSTATAALTATPNLTPSSTATSAAAAALLPVLVANADGVSSATATLTAKTSLGSAASAASSSATATTTASTKLGSATATSSSTAISYVNQGPLVQAGDPNNVSRINSGSPWSLPRAITPGNAIVLAVDAAGDTVLSVSDGSGSTWVKAGSVISGGQTLEWWYALNSPGGAADITVTTTGGGDYNAYASEWTNVAAVTFDGSNTGTSTSPLHTFVGPVIGTIGLVALRSTIAWSTAPPAANWVTYSKGFWKSTSHNDTVYRVFPNTGNATAGWTQTSAAWETAAIILTPATTSLVPLATSTSTATAMTVAAPALTPAASTAASAVSALVTAAAILTPSSDSVSVANARLDTTFVLTPVTTAISAAAAATVARPVLTPTPAAISAAQATVLGGTNVPLVPSGPTATSAAAATLTARALLTPTTGASSQATATLNTPQVIVAVGGAVTANGSGLTTLAVNPTAIGDLLVVAANWSASGPAITGISGGGVTVWFSGGTDVESGVASVAIYYGIITSVGAATLTVGFSPSNAGIATRITAQQFSIGQPAQWTLDKTGGSLNTVNSTTLSWPSLVPTQAGELYVGIARISNIPSAGSNPGYVYNALGAGAMFIYNGTATAATQAPTNPMTAGTQVSVAIMLTASTNVVPMLTPSAGGVSGASALTTARTFITPASSATAAASALVTIPSGTQFLTPHAQGTSTASAAVSPPTITFLVPARTSAQAAAVAVVSVPLPAPPPGSIVPLPASPPAAPAVKWDWYLATPVFQLINGWNVFQGFENIGLLSTAMNRTVNFSLNAVESASFSVNILDSIAEQIWLHALVNCVVLYRDGVIKWSGPIWTTKPTASASSQTLDVTCVGWFQYLLKRLLKCGTAGVNPMVGPTSTSSGIQQQYQGIDPTAIATDLVTRTNFEYPLPITIGSVTPNPNGILWNVTYQQLQNIGQAIQTLSNIEGGFDFRVDPATLQLDLSYGLVKAGTTVYGRGQDRPNARFSYPGNISELTPTEDGSNTVTQMTVLDQLTNASQYPAAGIVTPEMATYGMLQDTASISDISSATIPNPITAAYAEAEVLFRDSPEVIWTFTPLAYHGVSDVPQPLVDYDIGDFVYLTANYGCLQVSGPQAIRMFAFTLSLDNEGNETVTNIQSVFAGTG